MLTLIAFDGCPEAPHIARLLEDEGLAFVRVDPSGLPDGHPLRTYASPTLLWDHDILIGSRTDGAAGCALGLPSDDEVRALLNRIRLTG